MTIPMPIPVKRGCGIRIEGGIYIVTDAEIEELVDYVDMSDANIEGKLIVFPEPYPTLINLKPFRRTRGFDKKRFFYDLNIDQVQHGVTPQHYFSNLDKPPRLTRPRLKNCYYAHPEDSRSWLHWIGNQYYSIRKFIEEARLIGVSRRVPRDVLRKMKWGDMIFLASKEKKLKSPVIFGYFRLERIQGVKVDMEDLPEHLQSKMRYENMDF